MQTATSTPNPQVATIKTPPQKPEVGGRHQSFVGLYGMHNIAHRVVCCIVSRLYVLDGAILAATHLRHPRGSVKYLHLGLERV